MACNPFSLCRDYPWKGKEKCNLVNLPANILMVCVNGKVTNFEMMLAECIWSVQICCGKQTSDLCIYLMHYVIIRA